MENIQYLLHEQIDKRKWDGCITTASNSLIYGYSFYLDTMSIQWDALVLNDYEAVMPLTWNKKYGIHYLYQPQFTASLGVFGKNISAEILSKFLVAIPLKFKYCDIYLNHGNYFELKNFSLYQRMNYVLPLNTNYQNLHKGFKESTQRNIKKFDQLKGVIKKDLAVKDVVALSMQQAAAFSTLTKSNFDSISNLYQLLYQQGNAVSYGSYINEELMASALFFFSQYRAYYILVGNHPNGKTVGASHALINAFIKEYAGQDILLDFEGSDINSLAFFYSSFGATEEKYCGYKFNNLPKLIQLFKK